MKKGLLYIHQFLRPYYSKIVLASILVVVSIYASALPIKLLGKLIDTIKDGTATKHTIGLVIAKILLLSAVSGILLYLQRKIITESSRAMEYHARRSFLAFLHTRSPAFFADLRTGDILSLSTNDMGQVREMVGAGTLHILRTVVNLIVMLFMMVSISPFHTAIALLPVLLIPFVSFTLLGKIGRGYSMLQQLLGNINNTVQETFAGIGEVKTYNIDAWRKDCFVTEIEGYKRQSLRLARLTALIWPLFGFMASLSNLILLFVGGRSVISGELSIGNLISLSIYINAIAWPFISIGWIGNMFQKGMASAQRIAFFLEKTDPIQHSGTLPFNNGDIVISNLSFKYPNTSVNALSQINLTIKKGSIIAIVGTVGAGKSTLLNAMLRIIDIPDNKITINSIDIKSIDITSLRSEICTVPQESFLFSESIRDNIDFGISASEEAISEAIRISGLHKDISQFANGINTKLGERGINLSGGQRQRVAIARALLRKPSILLLDDALSAVDAATEKEILQAFDTFFKGRTIIIVTHRFGIVKNVDRIVVMDKGKIVEVGTHAELSSKKGLYYALYERQLVEESL